MNLVPSSAEAHSSLPCRFKPRRSSLSSRLFNSSRRRCAHTRRPVAVLGWPTLSHGSPLKEEGPWKQRLWSGLANLSNKAGSKPLPHCPKKKGVSFQLRSGVASPNMKKGGVFDMGSSRGWSMEEGDVGVDTNNSHSVLVPWRFKEQNKFLGL